MDDMRMGFSLGGLPINSNAPIPTQPSSSTRRNVSERFEEARKHSGILTLHNETHKVQLKELEVLEELNHGSFGTVYRCKWRDDIMAVKTMPLSSDDDIMGKILMDLEVIRLSYTCPHIVRFYGYFITETDIKICMERMATCFDSLLKRIKQPIPEEIIGKMSVSVINALHYLKTKHNIMHRDIKPSNILLDWNGVVKLCDFGISRRLVESRALTRSAGCYFYMAPERFDINTSSYDIRSDVWSFGITLYELATGKYPYSGNECQVIGSIMTGELPRLNVGDGFSPEFCDLVEKCLQRSPRDRPNFVQLLEHPFLKSQEDQETNVEEWLEDIMSMPDTE